MPELDRIWAGWRSPYIRDATSDPSVNGPRADGRSLFEQLFQSDLPEDQTYILWRGERCFAVLNAYPYGSGHLMVLPQRAVPELEGLEADESAELWAGVQAAVRAVKAAYQPHGVNVGANLGSAAGAGVPDHLHVHVLPRWSADSNFITAIAEARVLPEPLSDSWAKLKAAWPT